MSRTWLVVALSTAVPCGLSAAEPIRPGSHPLVFKHAGGDRKDRLYVPRGYDARKAVPLVFAFHGGGPRGTAATAEKGLGYNPLADTHGFLVCYPEGVEHHWNDGRESPRFPEPLNDDVDFVAKLLAEGLRSKFAPKHPVHVLHLHGTDDPAVPYQGGAVIARGGRCLGAADVVRLWVKANGCNPTPTVEVPPKKTDDPTKLRKESYAAGEGKAEVVPIAIEGHGHNWPGRATPGEQAGPSTKELNAAAAVWEFFQAHPKVRK
jgi:polyhydroxybutyrate depolymerase